MIEGPIQTNNSGLVFYFDTKEPKSYVGEPTTNLNQQVSNYTGTGYSSDGEWLSDPTRFTKTYDASIITPIGFGATLCTESGTAGFHHLSRMGGGGESGTHSISCYVKPLNSITDFTIGMLGDGGNQVSFNLSTKAITYGGGISNRNAFCVEVSGFPGWLYVGANIEGRFGGWVGCVGISTSSSYTPTVPYKAFYITGLQYEYKAAPTKFTVGTRSNTQGLLDLTGGSIISLANAGYNASSEIAFNGSSNYITIDKTATQLGLTSGGQMTVEVFVRLSSLSGYTHIVDGSGNRWHLAVENSGDGASAYFWNGSSYHSTSSPAITANTWVYIAGVQESSLLKIYINGVLATNGSLSSAASNLLQDCNVAIGYWQGNNSRYLNGQIGLVRIYNRALSASEILKNFNSQRSRYSV
jgi:hypothetical protein